MLTNILVLFFFFFFFFNDTATTDIYTLPLHDALPISGTPEFGEAVETYLMHELASYRDYVSGTPLAYWRSTSGFEVDFIVGGPTAAAATRPPSRRASPPATLGRPWSRRESRPPCRPATAEPRPTPVPRGRPRRDRTGSHPAPRPACPRRDTRPQRS